MNAEARRRMGFSLLVDLKPALSTDTEVEVHLASAINTAAIQKDGALIEYLN